MGIADNLQGLASRLVEPLRGWFVAWDSTTQQTYTPEYYGGTTTGVTTYAAGGQTGAYTRIGSVVVCSFRVEWTGATGTGEARVTLPIAATSATAQAAIVYPSSVAYGGDYLIGQIPASATYMNFRSPSTATASVLNVEAAGVLLVTVAYLVG